MTQYLVYRSGSNQANQKSDCMALAIVEASNKSEAAMIAKQAFTFYRNQESIVVTQNKAPRQDWESVLSSSSVHSDRRVVASITEKLSGWQPLPMPYVWGGDGAK
jgi:hypothetical protein